MADKDYASGGDRSVEQQRGGPPRGDPPAGRIYVGNLPATADKKMVEDLFVKYGTVTDISIKRTISGTPFAFVEYADPRDAQDAIRDRDGYKLGDCILRVEVPFSTRGIRKDRNGPPSRFGPSSGGGFPPRGTRRSEFRVTVRGLPPSGSWQDLKDHMREAGECIFADVYRDGTGVVEFARRDDMEYALKHFQNSRFKSHEGETSTISVSRTEGSSSRPHERSSSSNYRGGGGESGRHHRYSVGGAYPSSRGYGYSNTRDSRDYDMANREYRDSSRDYPPSRSTYDRYDPPSPRYDGARGGRDSYRMMGGRRSPSYANRRSRSRSRSFARYR